MSKFETQCDCQSCQVDVLAAFLAASDDMIAKALVVSEVAQIGRAEMRMRQFLTNKWRVRADEAAIAAGRAVAGGGSMKTAVSRIDKAMGKWSSDVRTGFTSEVARVYKLARIAGHKKASGKYKGSLAYQVPNFTLQLEQGKEKVQKANPKSTVAANVTFDLLDERAVADLFDDQMIWIGRHYGKNVRDTIRETVRPELVQGKNSIEAGKTLKAVVAETLRKVTIPGGFNGSDTKYFEGLAANTVTNARVRGQIRSFRDIEITTYVLVNPMDDRTTQQCAWMDGKKFSVEDAQKHIELLSGATDPDFVKKHHPWLSMRKIREISTGPNLQKGVDAKRLTEVGFLLPPFHFRCRTTVDVA